MFIKTWTPPHVVLVAVFISCATTLLYATSRVTEFSLPSYANLRVQQAPTADNQSTAIDHGSQAPVPGSDQLDRSAAAVMSSVGHQTPWQFDSARDSRNFALSEEQCLFAFPEFYNEIDRAAAFWRERGGINSEDNDILWQKNIGMARLMIYDQQLFIVEKNWTFPKYDVPRALSLLHSINRAIITSPTLLPNIEFTITLGDWPDDPDNKHPAWVLSRSKQDTTKWVMPDFGYWSWSITILGEYSDIRRQIKATEPTWAEKKQQAVWRGATATNPLREVLVSKSKGKSWSDIKAIEWKDEQPVVADGSGLPLTIPEHCGYRYVVHTEGHSYSGRTKYLLNCQSVSIIHEQEWIEPHSHLYKPSGPDQNMVLVRRDWSNLDKSMRRLLADDSKAQQIAANSAAVFRDRYLTPAAQTCYWRRLIRMWNQTSIFEPSFYTEGDGAQPGIARGAPYESFVADLIDPTTIQDIEWVPT